MLVEQHSGPLLGATTSCKEEYDSLVGYSSGLRVKSHLSGEMGAFSSERNTKVEQQASNPTAQRNLAPPKADISSEEQATLLKNLKRQEESDKGGENATNQVKQLQLVEDGCTKTTEYKLELVWTNIIAFIVLHSGLPLAVYLIYTQRPWLTVASSLLGIYLSMFGAAAGAHRLYSHRSYRAKWPVQLFLLVLQTFGGQNSAYTWARDHRLHHKYCETDADPHNIKRGLFFAHMGWLCCKKHPEVREKGKLIDMSDLQSNPYVMFQHRHYLWLTLIATVLVPTLIPVLCWGENLWTSFVLCFVFRYVASLHAIWLVNSAAHYHGPRPYDTSTEARDSMLLFISGIGEAAHNYHHTFPHDYRTPEFGRYYNATTAFIDLCARLGLVHGRRRVSAETIMKRRERTGDLAEER